MMQITLIHTGNAFLPEIEAYTRYFEALGFKVFQVGKEDHIPSGTDVEWRFMGIHPMREGNDRFLVHEYGSASTPPFSGLKNFLKKTINCKPDFRIFLNQYVSGKMNFSDSVPLGFRDMGISDEFKIVSDPLDEKKFDFVYIGDLSAGRQPEKLFSLFTTGSLKDRSLLVISNQYDKWKERLSLKQNIRFIGPVGHHEIPGLLHQARFGLNFIPDRDPFNQQTSVKFLEYLSVGLPVVTTAYPWIKEFQKNYGGNYFFLEVANPVSWESICSFPYCAPDLSGWSWQQQIENSGIVAALKKFERQKTNRFKGG